MRFFHKNNIIKKNQIRDEKQYQELKEEYKNKTLFYLDCKDSLSFLKKHYKNKEIIVTDSIQCNYVIDNELSDEYSSKIAKLIHYSIDTVKYSSFYLDTTDKLSYSMYDSTVFDTTNYFIRVMINTANLSALDKSVEELRQQHVKAFNRIESFGFIK